MTLVKPDSLVYSIEALTDSLSDTHLTVEDRAASYGVIHQIQLRLNRALKTVRDELILYMERNGLKALGPLSVKSTAIDVRWPCNDEGNWVDETVQGMLRDVVLPVMPEFVRHVPDHFEINTAALGEAVHMGDPAALQLHRELKDRGWRTEVGRRLSLAVKEVIPPKREAA